MHLSKEEQRERLLRRLEEEKHHWKFSPGDLKEREHWDEYQKYYEEAINKTSTDYAPWYVIPANRKWFRDLAVSQVLLYEFEQMPLKFPSPNFDPKAIKLT
jgi:polyphosphate kinase 2 (PPK2 family)